MASGLPPYLIEVVTDGDKWPAGIKVSIEAPINDTIAEALSVEFVGFVLALPNSGNTKASALHFVIDDRLMMTTPVNLPRPDCEFVKLKDGSTAGPNDIFCGFNAVLPSFLSLHDTEIRVMVVHEAEESGVVLRYELASIRFYPFAAATAETRKSDGMGVVSINSIGRSGSSLICRLLDTHPACFAPKLQGQYGEVAILGHYLRTVGVLASEGALAELNRLDQFKDYLTLPVGYTKTDPTPGGHDAEFQRRLMFLARKASTDLFRSIFSEIEEHLRDVKPTARYWVEKSWNLTSANLSRMLVENWKEIIIVRNFRSFYISQSLYQEKLLLDADSIEEHKSATYNKYVLLAESYRDRRDQVMLVRYEDLIADPETQFGRVLAYIGVDFDPATRDAVKNIVNRGDEHHRMLAAPEADAMTNAEYEIYLASIRPNDREYLNTLMSELGYSL